MKKWFYSGEKMPDGTAITVAAENDIQESEYVKRGCKPVKPVKVPAAGRAKETKNAGDKRRKK